MLLYYDLVHDDILGRDTPKLSWRKGPLDDDISNVFTQIRLFVLRPWKILSFHSLTCIMESSSIFFLLLRRCRLNLLIVRCLRFQGLESGALLSRITFNSLPSLLRGLRSSSTLSFYPHKSLIVHRPRRQSCHGRHCFQQSSRGTTEVVKPNRDPIGFYNAANF
ncbi:hypothetical protein AMTRI_Chr05g58790 [Amborella trichopoda]|uniref:Uncharacterized protein n=1 Tax=Amborella trichopoda TaxID=13333 RepID=U5CZ59_AMBTC|nr:hypothetical protein AMTR_s00056p00218790 [Amborella trichopoda]